MSDVKPEEKEEEGPKVAEVTGILVSYHGGGTTTANLRKGITEVAQALYASISTGEPALFDLANPEKQELFLLNPEHVLSVLISSQFHLDTGRIVKPGKNVPFNTKPTAPGQGRRR